jgi:hypothetical protein
MDNYFKNNLFEAYKNMVYACIGLVTVATLLTIYVLYYSYKNYNESTKNAFVFSENGASIHVFSNK